MKRHVEDKMAAWKCREGRKPLVLMGARQVGKTWLMHEFCKKNFRHVHEFNFDEQRGIAQLFAETKTPKELLPKLSALSGSKIDAQNDVLIFDEPLTVRLAIGMSLVIMSVTFIIAGGSVTHHLLRVRKMFPRLRRRSDSK